jgi:eukaryotic-like serine/threonine-protein kinase
MEKTPKDNDENPQLLRVAEAIVEGRAVDWKREGISQPEVHDELIQLRWLQSLAEGSRSSSPVEAEEGTPLTWGRLTLRAKLGEGSFGNVYRAYDPLLHREVALKLTRECVRDALHEERFLSEARRLAQVRHPNVLFVHGVEVLQGRVGIWTDLLEGRTLAEHLKECGTLGARRAALIGIDLCQALQAVHDAGIVHRDLKPSNIMMQPSGRVVLMDFGSGKDVQAKPEQEPTSHAYGTPLFMAPEQLRGEAVGPQADTYALGVLLYVAVSGQYPVPAVDLPELRERHVSERSIPLRDLRPELPEEFIRVVDRAILPDPRERFQTAYEMQLALQEVLEKSGSTSRSVPVRRRKHWVLVSVGAGLLVLAALLFQMGQPDEKAPEAILPEMKARPVPIASPVSATVSLYRARRGASERMVEGMRVEPGDDLYLLFESPESVYVYVLNEDDQGSVFVLFPVAGLDVANPLVPNVQHRLPGRLGGRRVNWEVSSAGGRERVFVVAGRFPQSELERDLASFPRAVTGRPMGYGRLSTSTIQSLRGIGTLVPEEAIASGGTSARAHSLGMLSGTSEQKDVWIWQIGLENPAP